MRLVPKILCQSLGILALSAVLAFAVNAMRPDGLPLAQAAKATPVAAPSAVQLSPSGGEIALKDAAMLFLSSRAVFLDARSQYEFEQGHIQGALSLPPRNFASDFQDIKPLLAGKDAVITYCDGEACTLSHSLAKHLRDAGVKNVLVLKNGWSLWAAEKLPVAKGSAVAPKAAAPKASAPKMSPAPLVGKPGASKDKGQDKLCTDCAN
jgi:rhodanese-related sulfurtransferase